MNNTAEFFDDNDAYWIDVNGDTDEIPGNTLDVLKQCHNNFSQFTVFTENNKDEGESFYDNMANHPRLGEFMDQEINSILANIKKDEVKKKLFEIISNKFAIFLGINLTSSFIDDLEEFLDYKKNVKSAGSSQTLNILK